MPWLLACAVHADVAPEQEPGLAGCMAQQAFDAGADGTVELVWTWRFDGRGLPVRVTGDMWADGTDDSEMRYTYDEEGRLIQRDWDGDSDGHPEGRTIQYYDEAGHNVVTEEDHHADGVLESRTTRTWSGPELILEEIDRGADGTVDSLVRIQSVDGRKVRSEHDQDADGVVDGVRTFAYDAAGNVTLELGDVGSDGVLDDLERTLWDGPRRMRQEWEQPVDGSTDRRADWTWTCDGNDLN